MTAASPLLSVAARGEAVSGAAVAPPAVYRGRTVHVRFSPFRHQLAYSIWQVLVDIDAPVPGGLKWLTHNRFGLLSFHDRDHGDRSGAPLRPWVEARLAEAGIDAEGGPIRLLTFPRVLGYVFNPISIFFAWRPDGSLAGVVYEVNNTFGDTHSYVAPAGAGAAHRQKADKVLHVSPFFDVSGTYAFTLRGPGPTLTLTIDKTKDGWRDHLATLRARAHPLTDRELMRAFFAIPLLTLKVIAAIHWEALKLVFKGARYHHRPAAPVAASAGRLADQALTVPQSRRPVSASVNGGG
jgi:uncharacterized protein